MPSPNDPLQEPPAPLGPRENPSVTKIDAFGIKLEIPLARWAIACLATVLIAAAVGASIYFTITKVGQNAFIPVDQLNVYQEDTWHQTSETPTSRDTVEQTFDSDNMTVTVTHFKSDGCVKIVTHVAGTKNGQSKWIFGENAHTRGQQPKLDTLLSPEFSGTRIELALNSPDGKGSLQDDRKTPVYMG